ncbi:MAG: hypothetical protein DI623_11905 [Sphingomonas sanxanigenens]|uniref:Uncharacterized protein n=1 Tax=Sphingomonas sanxanigenens TaxID=397260 RepID=A0A2W5A5Z5_9SPHN|nr:MAG: hypothetical protein DI623_11905 [Sphingomonas sanxanigenens]
MAVSHAFPDFETTEPPSLADLEALGTAQAHAALALGKLDAALAWCPPDIHPIFASRLIRETLISALRQEGHPFTDARFHAWFAGLIPLSDEPLQFALAPRALATTLLAEMTRSRWTPLADAALGLEKACLALRDPDSAAAVETAKAAIDEAAALVAALEPAPLPFTALAALHRAIGQSPRFAPAERTTDTIALANRQVVIERPRPPSPRWAIECAFGAHLQATGAHGAALPLNGLIRLDTVRAADVDDNPAHAAIVQAEALRDVLEHLYSLVAKARDTRQALADRYRAKRANSRVPQLYGLLASFGPLRSSQIEAVLGVTRLGVRKMLEALSEAGDLAIETVSGVKLYSVTRGRPSVPPTALADEPSQFSSEAIEDYDAALAKIDALLARYDDQSDDQA